MRIVFTGICLVGLVGCAADSALAPVIDLKSSNPRFGVTQTTSLSGKDRLQFVYCDTCPAPTAKTPFNAPEPTAGSARRGLVLREGSDIPSKPAAQPKPVKTSPAAKPARIAKPSPRERFGELLYITHFGFDSADVRDSERILIRQRVLKFHKSPGTITLIGYTDNRGDKRYNDWLAMKRAQSVKDYLVKNGMDPRRINVTSFGKCCYLQLNSTRAGRLANRRVEIRRVSGRG